MFKSVLNHARARVKASSSVTELPTVCVRVMRRTAQHQAQGRGPRPAQGAALPVITSLNF